MMKQRSSKALMAFIIPFLLSCSSAQAEVARDPGPRPTGANDQPQPLEGLTSGQTAGVFSRLREVLLLRWVARFAQAVRRQMI